MAKYKDVYAVLNPDLEPIEHFDKPFSIVAKERFEKKLSHAMQKFKKMGTEEHLIEGKAL